MAFHHKIQSRPLRDKLTLIISLAGIVVLLLAGTGMAAYQCLTGLNNLKHELEINASFTAGLLIKAIDSGDQERMQAAMDAPLYYEHYAWSAFRGANGDRVLTAARQREEAKVPSQNAVDGVKIAGGDLILFYRVVHEGRFYGVLSVATSLTPLWESMFAAMAASLLIVAICVVVALRFSSRLLDFILVPVRQLADTAGRITRSNNYSLRAIKQSSDELGRLTDAFNHMLDQIEKREHDLEHARNELEQKVQQLNREQEQLRQAQIRERRLQQRLVVAQRLESQNLRHAKEQAESLSTAKSEFLASMSHEIRTPMNGIMGFASLLCETELDEEQKELAAIIHSSANNLLTLLNDLLDFSKIEAGRIDLDYAPCNLESLMDEVESIFRHEIDRKQLAFKTTIHPKTPRKIVTDASRLRQILFNLAGNAIKFTDKGSVEIFVEATAVTGHEPLPEYSLNIEVRDSGIGIADSDQARIFNSFTQVDASATKRFGGAGLGLAITKRLTEILGGEIGVRSRLGEGSSFFISVPVRGAMMSSDAGKRNTPSPIEPVKPLRVLVAEDSPVSQKLLTALLQKRGHHTAIAGNGEDLLRVFEPGKFDVIVADIHMPVLDGLTAIRRLRKIEAAEIGANELPAFVIVVTADAVGNDREAAESAGADAYLNKPMVTEDFYKLLKKARERIEAGIES